MYRHGFTSFFFPPSPHLVWNSNLVLKIVSRFQVKLWSYLCTQSPAVGGADDDDDDDNNDVMMLCVRSWVFAGKVSPKFVQLAYKVPVSVSRDPHFVKKKVHFCYILIL